MEQLALGSAGKRVPLLSDVPLGTTGAIEYTSTRESLAQLAAGIGTVLLSTADHTPTPPILVSGDWGSGKTSLLRLVQRELQKCSESTLWFEAWRYEGAAPLLPALLRHVWDATPWKGKTAEGLRKLLKCALQAAPAVAGAAASAWGGSALPQALTNEKVLSALLGLGHTAPGRHPLDEVRERLKELVSHWAKKPLVIFVDDLDRCTPDGAVGLLDTLRALIVDAHAAPRTDAEQPARNDAASLPCRFIVALDRDVIAAAISKKFAGISDYDGNRYLEKVFPFTFHISTPRREEAASLLKDFVDRATEKGLDRTCAEALESALNVPVFANPRLMIRCINRFVVAHGAPGTREPRETGAAHGSDRAGRDYEEGRTLATWIAATERWPGLRRLMQQRDDAFWRDLISTGSVPALVDDPEARALVRQPGVLSWLRNELVAEGSTSRLRAADDRLRACGL